MMTPGSHHLTNDQFTEMIVTGVIDEACEKHLAGCELCREELTAFSDSVGLFSTTSLAWSESKPAESLRVAAHKQVRRAVYVPLRWAVAAAVVIGVAIPVWNYDHRATITAVADAAAATSDSPAEIAQDNQLLQSVNVALSTEESSPLPEYRLLDDSDVSGRSSPRPDSRRQ